jgi:hypothetical protein
MAGRIRLLIARQLTEAWGSNKPPRYVIRDRDDAYGSLSGSKSSDNRMTGSKHDTRRLARPTIPSRDQSRSRGYRGRGPIVRRANLL